MELIEGGDVTPQFKEISQLIENYRAKKLPILVVR